MTVNGSALGLAFVIAAASGCSSSSTPSPADSGSDASSGVTEGGGVDGGADAPVDGAAGIVVTSPGFAEGQPIPAVYTCAGADTSPQIDWTAGPSTTQSYAVVVSDLTATQNIHWVVWDLPPSTRSLPATLPGDPTLTSPVSAMQVDLRTNPEAGTTMNGYFGPCPRGAVHSYEFAVHAIDVVTLPGVTTTSRSADVKTVVLAHSLAEGTLDGTSNANVPTDAAGQ